MMMLPLANSSVECHLFLFIIRIWGYPANIPPSSLLGLKSLVKFKFLIYTEFARNLSFRLFRAGKKPPFFGTLSSISYQDVLGKSVGTKWLKILRGLNFVPVRFRSAAVDRSERDVDAAFLLFFCSKSLNTFEHFMKKYPVFEKQDGHSSPYWHSVGKGTPAFLQYFFKRRLKRKPWEVFSFIWLTTFTSLLKVVTKI